MPWPGRLPLGGTLNLPVQVGLGAGLEFEVRSKAKTSSDGALGRARGGEMSELMAPPPRPTDGRACYLGDSGVKASEGLDSCGEPGA